MLVAVRLADEAALGSRLGPQLLEGSWINMKPVLSFLVLLVALSLVLDVDASWKFWKKKKDDESTTASSVSTSATSSTTVQPMKTTPKDPKSSNKANNNLNKALAGASGLPLAVGVGNPNPTGGKLDQNNNNQPRKPDIGAPKLISGANKFEDWPADLVGPGPVREKPKVPQQGPALTPEDRLLTPGGGRPASYPGSANEPKPVVQPGTRPQSTHGTPNAQHVPIPGNTNGKATTPKTPSPSPIPRPLTPTPQPRPNPAGSQGNLPSPSGTRTYADVTNGGAHQGQPTPAQKPGSPILSRPGQHNSEQPHSGSSGQSAGIPGIATGAAAAGGAVVAGAAAAGAANSNNRKQPSYGGSSQSKGKLVTDEELQKLSETLFTKDVNNAYKYITINLQKTTSGNSPKDEAPKPLLEVKPEALQLPTIQKVLAIYDNYKLDTRENEYISPAQRQEESLLVDTFLSTNLMSAAMRFLADKGFIKKDYYEYKDTLRSLWFNLYSRGEGKIGSSGFEHVFLTELKLGTEVSGLHNWIYFNAEELKHRLDYLGYIKKIDLGNKAAIVKTHVRFNGIDKPVTNIFVGTSPELEMALYTVCFFARPDASCPVSLGGTKFNIITHRFRYRGRDVIGSAYPEI